MDFEKINPIKDINDNVIITACGDISLCYQIELPVIGTTPCAKFNQIHSALLSAINLLPENTLIHRQDIFLRKSYDSSTTFDQSDYYQNSLANHFRDRTYLNQDSYIYITLLNGFGFKRGISSSSFFKRSSDTGGFENTINEARIAIEKAVSVLNDTLSVSPLSETKLASLITSHLNGYEPNKVCSPVFKPDFKIGSKYFNILGLDTDLNQSEAVTTCIRNETMSTDTTTVFKGYLSVLGQEFEHEHVVNSYISYDNQSAAKKNLEDKRKKLSGSKALGRANALNAEKLEVFLNDIENEGVKLVRAHFNVVFWSEDQKELSKASNNLQTKFAHLNIVPTEFSFIDHPFLLVSSVPGAGGHLPHEYYFTTYLNLAINYTLTEGMHINNDAKGNVYTSRLSNIPFRLDTFYKPYQNKLIDNRNYIVIAPSGGGKSFSSRNRQLQQYHQGFDQVVINLGGDDKMVRLINGYGKNEAQYIKYEEGDSLPINPFFIEDNITNEKIDFIINFIWLIWGGKDEISKNYSAVLREIIMLYYEVDAAASEEKSFFKISRSGELSIQSFYEFIISNTPQIEQIYKGDKSVFSINSLTLNLKNFAEGTYANLFSKGKPSLTSDKKYVEFELDNIKGHDFLFPLFSMLISDLTFNTMWTSSGYKDFFIDEAWMILEKPGMALFLKYLFKTIRKFDGAVGIAVQQITDLDVNNDTVVSNAITGNCAIKYILNHKNVTEQVPTLARKLSLTENDTALLLSIQNKLKRLSKDDTVLYTELLLIMGSEFSMVVRNEVSPELAQAYASDKAELRIFDDLYYRKANEDFIKAIELKLNN